MSPKVTLKVTPKSNFFTRQVTQMCLFSGQNVTLGVIPLELLWGRPQKSLFGRFQLKVSSDFEFFGVSRVLGGQHFLNSSFPLLCRLPPVFLRSFRDKPAKRLTSLKNLKSLSFGNAYMFC